MLVVVQVDIGSEAAVTVACDVLRDLRRTEEVHRGVFLTDETKNSVDDICAWVGSSLGERGVIGEDVELTFIAAGTSVYRVNSRQIWSRLS